MVFDVFINNEINRRMNTTNEITHESMNLPEYTTTEKKKRVRIKRKTIFKVTPNITHEIEKRMKQLKST